MLQIKNISKTYKVGSLITKALDNVSLNLRDNEFVAILGPSGSGKTTLLNIIGGLDRYDKGDLVINGISTKDYKDRDWDAYRNHTIGFVFQSYNLIPHQTILSNVELALTISGIKKKERKRRALKALEEVGLLDQAHKKPNQLSGGQMQRVAIARALVNNPDILLADEPTGALDTKTSIQVMNLLKEVAKDRLVVMVTHNPELANEYANRIINLRDGSIIGDSNPFNISQVVVAKKKKFKKASMNFLTALSLSFNNLLTKKGRTILTAFAGSIGIIGIALILSLSTGFQNYIDKIQEDTMTSYPLTIQSDTADIFSALLSMRIDSEQETKPGEVKEIMLASSMMNSVGTNDLKSFKQYLEDNTDKYENDVNKITYSYSVSPRIYTIDVTNNVTQLNPNTLMSSFYSDNLASAFSSLSASTSTGAFSLADFSTLQDKYTLVKGKYPVKYNEVLMVLPKENQISDLLIYMLGLRDSKDLKTLLQSLMNYEKVTIENEPMIFTYDQLMDIDLKLIDASDMFKYNSTYDTYEDMSTDKDYMLDLYNKSEELIITGVAYSTDDTSAGGIMYSKALVDHVIEVAKNSPIVQKQLRNKDLDVFSGNKFDEENDKKQDLNFEDMISIDEDLIKEAFQVNISEDDIISLADPEEIEEIVTEAMDTSAITIEGISKGITQINSQLLSQMVSTYESIDPNVIPISNLDTSTTPPSLTLIKTIQFPGLEPTTINMYEQFANMAINAETYKNAVNLFASYSEDLGKMKDMFVDSDYEYLASSLKKSFIAYYEELLDEKYRTIDGVVPVTINDAAENPVVIGYGSTETISKSDLLVLASTNTNALKDSTNAINRIVSSLAPGLVAQGSATTAMSISTSILGGLADLMGEDMMTIDTDKFAQAFKFDMDEDELSRLMTSLMTGSTASYRNNLVSLGYQDYNEPTSISIYFKDFDSKERFLEFLDSYNDNVNDDEKKIKYADITGLLMGSVKKIIDSVTYVLIAFVSISLVVSSIMIAVITLISVMERTKEIGILRAMGASKHNVSSIFNAETFIIGLLSGLLGIGVTLLSIPPINALIHNVTDNYDINAVLPKEGAIALIIIAVFLTIFAGIIPSKKASKQDPVIALRTE